MKLYMISDSVEWGIREIVILAKSKEEAMEKTKKLTKTNLDHAGIEELTEAELKNGLVFQYIE